MVSDALGVRLTGNKATQKLYRHHSGFIGGLKEVPISRMRERRPEAVSPYSLADGRSLTIWADHHPRGVWHVTEEHVPRPAPREIKSVCGTGTRGVHPKYPAYMAGGRTGWIWSTD